LGIKWVVCGVKGGGYMEMWKRMRKKREKNEFWGLTKLRKKEKKRMNIPARRAKSLFNSNGIIALSGLHVNASSGAEYNEKNKTKM
jgi:hypothetical protein